VGSCAFPGCDWPPFLGEYCYRHKDGTKRRDLPPLSKEARSYHTAAAVVERLVSTGWTREQIGRRVLVKTSNLRELQSLLDEPVPV
jgi:hypothetical protein